MGSVWLFVVVLSVVGHVFSKTRNCSEEALESMKNCDECIRCGGYWCLDTSVKRRCTKTPTDSWCGHRYDPYGDSSSILSVKEDSFDPHHRLRFVKILNPDQTEFTILLQKPAEIEIGFVNSTNEEITWDPRHIQVTHKVTKMQGERIVEVIGTPQTDFCPAKGNLQESITLKLSLKGEDVPIPSSSNIATLTYQVPCACDYVDVDSESCNRRGNYSRGVCSCQRGWKGEACEIKESHCERGDIGECRNPSTNELCSGNGVCNCGGMCDCDMSKEGSQYFDHYCTDICMTTSYCDACLLNPPIGQCHDCHYVIFVDPLNRTLLDDTDVKGRKIWVECVEKADTCSVKYVAMNDGETTHIMILEPCNALAGSIIYGEVNVTVPVIVGLLALVAAAAAVAGYMAWRNRAPPLPLNDPGYTNIDAEDCTGENPLYKPPTSNFKNPTYGKW